MRLRATVALFVARLAVGVFLGSVIGGIFTGDYEYTIVWSVALPVMLLAATFGVSALSKARRPTRGAPGRPPGIISTMGTGAANIVRHPPRPAHNSVSPGAVLNGVPLSDPAAATIDPTVTPAASATAASATEGESVSGPPRPPFSTRLVNRVIALGPVVLAFALTLIPAYGMIAWSATDVVAGRPFDGKDMRVGLHQQEAMDQLFQVIGSTEIYEVHFYDSYVLVEAPTYPGASTSDDYEWRYGRAFRDGPELIQPDPTRDHTFDAGRIDFSMLADLVRKSEADTGWTGFTSYYPSVYGFGDDDPAIVISLNTDYYDATYKYTLNGEFISRNGSGLGDASSSG